MAQTPNLLITEVASNQNQKEVTLNQAIIELEAALTNPITIALPDADYTLSAGEDGQALGNMAFDFTGTITAQRNIIVPNNPKLYLIQNATNLSLGFGLIIKTLHGSGVTIPNIANQYVFVYCDGTNVVLAGSFGGSGTVTNTSSALTAHDVILGNGGTDAKPLGSTGTAGQVLTSNGPGVDPSWQAGGSGGGGGNSAQAMRRQAWIATVYNPAGGSTPGFAQGTNGGYIQIFGEDGTTMGAFTLNGKLHPNFYSAGQGANFWVTPNTAASLCGTYGNAGQLMWYIGFNLSMFADLAISTSGPGGTVPSDVRCWMGYTDTTPTNFAAIDTPGTSGYNFVGFRYSTNAGDTSWQCVVANGATQTIVSSGVAGDAKNHRFSFNMNDTPGNVMFYIDGTLVATISTNLPAVNTGVTWFYGASYTTTSGVHLGFAQMILQSDN